MVRRSLLVLAFAVLATRFGPASAGPPAACEAVPTTDAALAAYCAGARAESALQALSERYSAIWASLGANEKSAFSAAERRWLSAGRYAERDACVEQRAQGGAAPVWPDLVAAQCLADVTARRLIQLDDRFAAAQRAPAGR